MTTDLNTKDKASNNVTKLYFDTEFTGLHKNTTLISIGIISDQGVTFYAELQDYDVTQVDDWIETNVITKLEFSKDSKCKAWVSNHESANFSVTMLCKDKEDLKTHLNRWLNQFEKIEMYSDCLAYDWVLFNDVFGNALNIHSNIYYIPFDLCSFLKVKGLDPDVSRKDFAGATVCDKQHNALYDARLIKACFEKLESDY